MADLFGFSGSQWGREGRPIKLHQGDEAYKHYEAAQKNPEQYTTNKAHGGAKAAFTMEDWSSSGIDDSDYDEVISFYKIEQPKPAAAAAPAPEPKREPYKAPEQVGTSDKLANANQYLQNYTKSGKNFQSSTLSERQAKTDSFKQKPAYDPNAGVSSPEAGNFLDDYKLDLQKTIKDFRG